MITWILLGGALSGAGVLMLVLILAPPAVQPAAALAELDSQRDERRLRQEARRLNPRERALPDWLDALGYRAAALLRRTGIDLGALTSDLSVLGRSLERHLVTSLLLGLLGFGAPLLITALGALAGRPTGSLPLLACLVLGAAMAALPTVRLRSGRRRPAGTSGTSSAPSWTWCPCRWAPGGACPRPSTPPPPCPTTPPWPGSATPWPRPGCAARRDRKSVV